MKGLSLFSGIGASDIALALAGVELVAWSEVEEHPSQIMRLRYPEAEELGDVRHVDATAMQVDVVVAGFPCQDISNAGPRKGIKDGTRSSLWTEVDRIIDECRPQLVFLENVEAIRRRGLDIVLTDLADIGYEAAWDCIPAAAVGAPHLRDRWWCVAAPKGRLPWDIFGMQLEMIGRPIAEYDRLPRAARMRDGEVFPTEPVAPKKLKRQDGWSLWNGVRLDHGEGGAALWPTPAASEPNAGESLESWLARKERNLAKGYNGNGQGIPLSIAANMDAVGMREYPAGLWPTPVTTDAFGSRRATAKTEEWKSNDGTTLSDAVILDADGTRPQPQPLLPTPLVGDATGGRTSKGKDRPNEVGLRVTAQQLDDGSRLWPTPRVQDGTSGQDTARAARPDSGGDDLVTRMYKNAPGMLHPDWVEWLMGLPIGWTNPDVPNDGLVWRDWSSDEGIPRTVPPRAGYPLRKERLKACGNTLVWQVLFWVVQRTISIQGSEAAA